ncbi:MAG TPA: hypothetical protein VFA69_09885 [Candidatus Nitrosotalea sp.]|nr:hypothetical protein [Candidatus Nitrosotalea sp.]
MISRHQPSLNEMWKFIDNMMRPNNLVPDKSILTHDQVFQVYSKLYEIDHMFNDLAQVNILKKELASLKS